MTKHRVELTTSLSLTAEVVYEVEFDTETGEAEIVGPGRVTQYQDTFRKRDLQNRLDFDGVGGVDGDAYQALIEAGKLPSPKPNEIVILSGKKMQLYANDDDVSDLSTSELLDRLDEVGTTWRGRRK